MRQLTYISTARADVGDRDVDQILARSRLNNGAAGLTGLLLYDGRRFLQALEGPDEAVARTFERIKADPRHRAVVLLSSKDVEARAFGDWAMAAHRAVPRVDGGASLIDTVDRMVGGLGDPSIRALFEGFVRVERKAA